MPTGALVGLSLTACSAMGVPRPQDSQAPHDFYAQLRPEGATCDREVAILPSSGASGRKYKELASISATCSPGSQLCERRLKDRACELGADAVILTEPSSGPNPPGGSSQSLVSQSGRAVRWETP
jgi:hypothetical protein